MPAAAVHFPAGNVTSLFFLSASDDSDSFALQNRQTFGPGKEPAAHLNKHKSFCNVLHMPEEQDTANRLIFKDLVLDHGCQANPLQDAKQALWTWAAIGLGHLDQCRKT